MKRLIDIIISFFGLLILSPLMVSVAWMILKKMGRPILYKQLRPGLDGKPFWMYKFRTMLDLRDKNGQLLPDSERLTAFGSGLRSTSIDELPELFNVLKGDMSLVGPRPLLIQYLDRYTSEQSRRHSVKPGLTGWAQVNGRNTLSWEKRFVLDVWYVDHVTLLLDLKILLMTLKKVLCRDGINQPGEATMSEFMGATAKDSINAK